MVKPDVKHNYYADLELPTTASIDDIRKAYRKLALQYHPDRNAGKEAECVPRFQAIQAANEVLSDATIKAKYDQDRRKASLYPTSNSRPAGPTGNPYQATSAYPPPPRRTQPGTWQRPTPTAGANPGPTGQVPTGADRFANFTRATGTMPPKNPAADRTQQFRAWQKMSSGPERPTPEQQTRTNPERPVPRPPAPPPPQRGPQPPRPGMPSEEKIRANFAHRAPPQAAEPDERATAWQHWKTQQQKQAAQEKAAAANNLGRSKTQRTPKKAGGFDPNAPGSDERAAPTAGSRYFHRHRSEDLGSPMSEYPPPPPGPPPGSTPESPMSPMSQRSYDATSPMRPPFRSRTTDETDVPYAEGNRKSTPYSSFIGEKTQFSTGGLNRSASTKDTTKLNPESARTSRARSTSPTKKQPSVQKPQTRAPTSKPFVAYSSSSEDSSDSSESEVFSATPEEAGSGSADSTRNTRGRPSTAPTDSAPFSTPMQDRPKKTPISNNRKSRAYDIPPSPSEGTQSANKMPSMQQRQSGTNIFTIPATFDRTSSTMSSGKSRSEENINTKFTPDGWSGTFTAATDYFSPPPSAGRKNSPKRGNKQRSGLRSATTDVPVGSSGPQDNIPPRPFGSDGTQSHPVRASPIDSKFSNEEWEQAFKDGSWAWPPPPPNPPSDSRSASGSKMFSTGTSHDPHVIDDNDHENIERANVDQSATTSNDTDAMDIDTPPPAASQADNIPSQGNTSKEPRMYSVEPSTWHRVQANTSRKASAASARRSQKSAADSRLNTNLDDLSTVEPLAPGTNGGLKNLADMSSTLPFQSQASSTIPIHTVEPQELQTPPVPHAPEVPSRLTKLTWLQHVQAFGQYLDAFHGFNRIMLTHFDAREKQAQARMSGGMGWLEATGDSSSALGGHSGFGSYLKGVREDEAVRETWKLGCERHCEAVKEFDRIRERVKKMVAANTMADY